MMRFESLTKEMVKNTKTFYEYVIEQKRKEYEKNVSGAFSWLFDSTHVPPPPRENDPTHLTETECYVIERLVTKSFKQAWGDPRRKILVVNMSS